MTTQPTTAAPVDAVRAALEPFANISLARDTDPSAPDMIEGPDLAITPNDVRRARAALRASPPSLQHDGEPVAWLYEVHMAGGHGDYWSQRYSDTKPIGNQYQRNIRPLYLTSPPATALDDGGVDELIRFISSQRQMDIDPELRDQILNKVKALAAPKPQRDAVAREADEPLTYTSTGLIAACKCGSFPRLSGDGARPDDGYRSLWCQTCLEHVTSMMPSEREVIDHWNALREREHAQRLALPTALHDEGGK